MEFYATIKKTLYITCLWQALFKQLINTLIHLIFIIILWGSLLYPSFIKKTEVQKLSNLLKEFYFFF